MSCIPKQRADAELGLEFDEVLEGPATVNVRTATVNVRTQEKLILESHDEVLEGALSYLESRWAGTARLLWVTDGLPKQTCV